jgi:hypothetical protein
MAKDSSRIKLATRKNFFSSLAVIFLVSVLAITIGSLGRAHSPTEKILAERATLHDISDHRDLAHGQVFGRDLPLPPNINSTSEHLTKRQASSYEQRIKKGEQLRCLMQASIDTATKMNGGTSLEAEVQSPDYFEIEGWEPIVDSRAPFFKTALDNAFALPNINIDKSKNAIKDYKSMRSGYLIPEDQDTEDYITIFVSMEE